MVYGHVDQQIFKLYKAEVIRRKTVSRLLIIINKFKTTTNYNNYLIQNLKLTFINI